MCVPKFSWGRRWAGRLWRGGGRLLMRLALGCITLGEALADWGLRCAIWGSGDDQQQPGGPAC